MGHIQRYARIGRTANPCRHHRWPHGFVHNPSWIHEVAYYTRRKITTIRREKDPFLRLFVWVSTSHPGSQPVSLNQISL